MNKKLYRRLLDFMNRTGDRAVIVDEHSEELYMMMGLESYENVLNNNQSVKGLSEEEMMSKINRDIALWRSLNENGSLDWYKSDQEKEEIDDYLKDVDENSEVSNIYDEYRDVMDNEPVKEDVLFDDLDRDGFVIDGEEDEENEEEDLLYFEKVDNEPLSSFNDVAPIGEIEIDADKQEDKEIFRENDEEIEKDDVYNKFEVSESLEDVEEIDEDNEEDKFFLEPVE